MFSHTSSNRKFRTGQSVVEMALAMPLLLLLIVGACDLARAFFQTIQLYNAARAGVQYGAQSITAAADSASISAAASADVSSLSGMSVSVSQCTCLSGSNVSACGATSAYCSANSESTWVEVDTSAPFTTLIPYPGFPRAFTLSGKAVMQVSS
jgi:Flp pilus assembly protein TadG